MDAAKLDAAEPLAGDLTAIQGAETSTGADSALGRTADDLQRLMAIADRYARRLVMDTGPPADALVLMHDRELKIAALTPLDRDAATLGRLLARRGATVAALLLDGMDETGGEAEDMFCIVGASVDGTRAAWRYRVRRCGRGRRLTRLLDKASAADPAADPDQPEMTPARRAS